MAPRLLPGDRLYVDRRAYDSRVPGVGDLVVLKDPEDLGRLLVKSVAGVGPGQFQIGRQGVFRVDRETDSPVGEDSLEELDLPAGHLLVLSEPGAGGRDSRRFGAVRVDAVVGQVWWRYAPADRAGAP